MTKGREIEIAAAMMLFGAGALVIVSYGTVATNVPTIKSPFSLTVALAVLDSWGPVAFMIWPILFLIWGIPLFSRTPAIPIRSVVFMVIAWFSGVGWVLANWQDGVMHQGPTHVAVLFGIDLFLGPFLLWILVRSRSRPSFAISFAFHWLLFAWIAWGALPWLGEGI